MVEKRDLFFFHKCRWFILAYKTKISLFYSNLHVMFGFFGCKIQAGVGALDFFKFFFCKKVYSSIVAYFCA